MRRRKLCYGKCPRNNNESNEKCSKYSSICSKLQRQWYDIKEIWRPWFMLGLVIFIWDLNILRCLELALWVFELDFFLHSLPIGVHLQHDFHIHQISYSNFQRKLMHNTGQNVLFDYFAQRKVSIFLFSHTLDSLPTRLTNKKIFFFLLLNGWLYTVELFSPFPYKSPYMKYTQFTLLTAHLHQLTFRVRACYRIWIHKQKQQLICICRFRTVIWHCV